MPGMRKIGNQAPGLPFVGVQELLRRGKGLEGRLHRIEQIPQGVLRGGIVINQENGSSGIGGHKGFTFHQLPHSHGANGACGWVQTLTPTWKLHAPVEGGKPQWFPLRLNTHCVFIKTYFCKKYVTSVQIAKKQVVFHQDVLPQCVL